MGKKVLGRYAQKNKNFASAIESCMKRKRCNGVTIADRAGISFSTHYKWLKDPEKINIGALREYINYLDIPEDDILDALYLHREKK